MKLHLATSSVASGTLSVTNYTDLNLANIGTVNISATTVDG